MPSSRSECCFPQNTELYSYTKGCRCDGCVNATREYKARYRAAHPNMERRVGRRADQKRAHDHKRVR